MASFVTPLILKAKVAASAYDLTDTLKDTAESVVIGEKVKYQDSFVDSNVGLRAFGHGLVVTAALMDLLDYNPFKNFSVNQRIADLSKVSKKFEEKQSNLRESQELVLYGEQVKGVVSSNKKFIYLNDIADVRKLYISAAKSRIEALGVTIEEKREKLEAVELFSKELFSFTDRKLGIVIAPRASNFKNTTERVFFASGILHEFGHLEEDSISDLDSSIELAYEAKRHFEQLSFLRKRINYTPNFEDIFNPFKYQSVLGLDLAPSTFEIATRGGGDLYSALLEKVDPRLLMQSTQTQKAIEEYRLNMAIKAAHISGFSAVNSAIPNEFIEENIAKVLTGIFDRFGIDPRTETCSTRSFRAFCDYFSIGNQIIFEAILENTEFLSQKEGGECLLKHIDIFQFRGMSREKKIQRQNIIVNKFVKDPDGDHQRLLIMTQLAGKEFTWNARLSAIIADVFFRANSIPVSTTEEGLRNEIAVYPDSSLFVIARILKVITTKSRNTVIIPEASFDLLQITPNIAKVNLEIISTADTNFKLSAHRLEELATAKSREKSKKCPIAAVLLTNPTNPFGLMYSKKELEELLTVAIRHDIVIICDEIFAHLEHDKQNEFTSLASLSIEVDGQMHRAFDHVVTVKGSAKFLGFEEITLTGMCTGNKSIISQIEKKGFHFPQIEFLSFLLSGEQLRKMRENVISQIENSSKDLPSFIKRINSELGKELFFIPAMPEGGCFTVLAVKKSDVNKYGIKSHRDFFIFLAFFGVDTRNIEGMAFSPDLDWVGVRINFSATCGSNQRLRGEALLAGVGKFILSDHAPSLNAAEIAFADEIYQKQISNLETEDPFLANTLNDINNKQIEDLNIEPLFERLESENIHIQKLSAFCLSKLLLFDLIKIEMFEEKMAKGLLSKNCERIFNDIITSVLTISGLREIGIG